MCEYYAHEDGSIEELLQLRWLLYFSRLNIDKIGITNCIWILRSKKKMFHQQLFCDLCTVISQRHAKLHFSHNHCIFNLLKNAFHQHKIYRKFKFWVCILSRWLPATSSRQGRYSLSKMSPDRHCYLTLPAHN